MKISFTKKRLTFLLLLIIIFSLLYLVFIPKQFDSENKVIFSVAQGQNTRDIAYNLETSGLVHSGPVFRLYVTTMGIAKNLKAGAYELNSGMSLYQIARKIVRGDTLKETLAIIEGQNIRDIGFILENKGMFQAEELWELVGFPGIDYRQTTDLPLYKDFSKDYPFLKDKPAYVGLEGYLFPDTYHAEPGESLEKIVRRILTNFGQKTTQFQDEIASQQKTWFEMLTTASLLEKEVQTLHDKKMVAHVLQKRLDIGMPLQVDATVTYVVGRRSEGKVLLQDTLVDSPFNTYKYAGLPLGPIANPGLLSIEATLFPIENPYYFYLSTSQGETIFSQTLEEHNIAKNRYLR